MPLRLANSRALRALLPALLVQIWAAGPLLAQCDMCKEAVDGDKAAGGSVADGISMSILFMLALPPLVLGGFGFAVWRSYRKAGAGSA